MEIHKVARLDPEEAATVKTAYVSVYLIAPRPERDERACALRAATQPGQDLSPRIVERALAGAEELRRTAERESTVGYWARALARDPHRPITPDTPGGDMVARPWEVCEGLAASRQLVARNAADAVAVLAAVASEMRKP